MSHDGNIASTHSVSAGLDYCGVSPILSYLNDKGRVSFEQVDDRKALDTLKKVAKYEGIIPALESAHAFAYAIDYAAKLDKKKIVVINASGRGEKDLFISMKHFQKENFSSFLQNQLDISA